MSLIEDAARRLEELRRAGAELPETRAEPPRTAKSNGDMPLPEAVVAAMESKRSESALSEVRTSRLDAPMEVAANDGSGARLPGRYVELNLEKLRTLGFVTPDVPTSQMADEFRVVKRPIIRNALGKGDGLLRAPATHAGSPPIKQTRSIRAPLD